MTTIFDQQDTRAMLHAVYVMEELAWGIDLMPIAPSDEALTELYSDLCPNGPSPSKSDWGEEFRNAMEYAAADSAWEHERYGCEGVEAYRKYHEDMEREMRTLESTPRLDGRPAVALEAECDQCGQRKPVLYGQDACTLGYPGHPGAEWTSFQLCEQCLTAR